MHQSNIVQHYKLHYTTANLHAIHEIATFYLTF